MSCNRACNMTKHIKLKSQLHALTRTVVTLQYVLLWHILNPDRENHHVIYQQPISDFIILYHSNSQSTLSLLITCSTNQPMTTILTLRYHYDSEGTDISLFLLVLSVLAYFVHQVSSAAAPPVLFYKQVSHVTSLVHVTIVTRDITIHVTSLFSTCNHTNTWVVTRDTVITRDTVSGWVGRTLVRAMSRSI